MKNEKKIEICNFFPPVNKLINFFSKVVIFNFLYLLKFEKNTQCTCTNLDTFCYFFSVRKTFFNGYCSSVHSTFEVVMLFPKKSCNCYKINMCTVPPIFFYSDVYVLLL